MRKISLASGLVIAIIGMGLIIGCGGSGSKNTTKDNTNAPLDTRSIETMGQNVAELVPGCVFTSNTVSTTMNLHNMKTYKAVYSTIVKPTKNTRVAGEGAPLTGSCGGTLETSGTEANMHYTFTNYCTGGENIRTTINGTFNVSFIMEGDELKSASASTGTGGITTTTVENGETTTESLYLNNLKYTGTGDPKKLTIDELKIVSTQEGEYRLTDVEINQYGDPETGTVEIHGATYYDPEIGAVTLSTSKLPMGENATGPGSVTISRSGQSATFTTDDISSGKFDVEQNGQKIGALDCSVALTEI